MSGALSHLFYSGAKSHLDARVAELCKLPLEALTLESLRNLSSPAQKALDKTCSGGVQAHTAALLADSADTLVRRYWDNAQGPRAAKLATDIKRRDIATANQARALRALQHIAANKIHLQAQRWSRATRRRQEGKRRGPSDPLSEQARQAASQRTAQRACRRDWQTLRRFATCLFANPFSQDAGRLNIQDAPHQVEELLPPERPSSLDPASVDSYEEQRFTLNQTRLRRPERVLDILSASEADLAIAFDAQLYTNRLGKDPATIAVFTQDSDAITLRSHTAYRFVCRFARCLTSRTAAEGVTESEPWQIIDKAALESSPLFPFQKQEELHAAAIVAQNDYCSGVPGLGLAKLASLKNHPLQVCAAPT